MNATQLHLLFLFAVNSICCDNNNNNNNNNLDSQFCFASGPVDLWVFGQAQIKTKEEEAKQPQRLLLFFPDVVHGQV